MNGRTDEYQLLTDWDDRIPWEQTAGELTATEVLRGHPSTGFDVVWARAPRKPKQADLNALWRRRAGGGADPVLVAVEYPTHDGARVSLHGLRENSVTASAVERALAERVIEHALELESPSGLYEEMRRRLGALSEQTKGYRNEGLLASHVLDLEAATPQWQSACTAAIPLLDRKGAQLMSGLGYQVAIEADGAILNDSTSGEPRAAAILLADDESLDSPLSRFHGLGAVSHGLAFARSKGVDWLVVSGGSVCRLFATNPETGVGRKGQTQTFVEVDLALLTPDQAGYLTVLFSPGALGKAGDLQRLLSDSGKYAVNVASRLRDRVYEDIVPTLAVAIADQVLPRYPQAERREALDDAYHQTMVVLFRLLFMAYAEERGLLEYPDFDAYSDSSLRAWGRRILDDPDREFEQDTQCIWRDMLSIFDLIDSGDADLNMPPYNGGLFTRDSLKNARGAQTYSLTLSDRVMGAVLRGLLLDDTAEGVVGPVDFRSLQINEFGVIYEGLLDAGVGVASVDLVLDQAHQYVPAASEGQVDVPEGGNYFHTRSGARKAGGAYFTPPFAVSHLLDFALDPVLDEHLTHIARLLDEGHHRQAADTLFDFRVADIAMGSGNFLVSAVDRMEAKISVFLAEHPMPEVTQMLADLRVYAAEQLGLHPAETTTTESDLLRRHLARHCIYGVDINHMAVELARLAVWVQTFVPGLPLSFLNHGLIHGDSLTGVGTLAELENSLSEAEERELGRSAKANQITHMAATVAGFLDGAQDDLHTLATSQDKSVAEVQKSLAAQQACHDTLKPLHDLCDLVAAERTTRHLKANDPSKFNLGAGGGGLFMATDASTLRTAITMHPQLERARRVSRELGAIHFPVAYGEVFTRDASGFDVILGNPPWEKLKVEEHQWWGLRYPGLRGLPDKEKDEVIAGLRRDRPNLVDEFEGEATEAAAAAKAVVSGPYPGIGASDIDKMAAFAWRFRQLTRPRGALGVVLPRTALAGAACSEWRRRLLGGSTEVDLTTLTNTGRWVFDMEARSTIALVGILEQECEGAQLSIRGPFASRQEFEWGVGPQGVTAVLPPEQVLTWSTSASIPLLPAGELDVFATMKRHPRFDAEVGDWRFRPVRELDTTKEKRFYDFSIDRPAAQNTLEVWTGGTFNLWSPGLGQPYAFADPEVISEFLQSKRQNQRRTRSSAFFYMPEGWVDDPETLPMRHARIAFRDVARATDSRTMLSALVPPGIVLVHTAPFLLRIAGSAQDEAFLLGVMSSLPFDWLVRRYAEQHMTFNLLNSLPIPRVDSTGRWMGFDSDVSEGPDLSPVRDRIVDTVGRLAAIDRRYETWASEVGVPTGTTTGPAMQNSIYELDALVAMLYGLSEDQLTRQFASFHRGWDYADRLAAVVEHYRRWATELRVGSSDA